MNPTAMMPETNLADRALQVLERNPHLPRRIVRLEAEQGRLILRGVVKSYFQKQMAQESLRGLEGLEQIENHLQVEWA